MAEPYDDPLRFAKERAWRELAEIDTELSAGSIDDEEWHRRVLAVVEPAYLGRRFTYVRTGLDYAPKVRRAEYVEHLMTNYVEPCGRLIVGTFNEETGADHLADEVAGWGWTIAGRSARRHSVDGLSYKAFWMDRPG